MFESERYKELRQALISLFEKYRESRQFLEHSTGNRSDGLDKDALESIEKRINLIKENKYLLVVAGESNSGKSSFINGLLGKSILPMAGLQCTSTIIEIINTNNLENDRQIYLKTTYGNTKEEIFSNVSDIQAKLPEIAAISEEYRYLPIQQLNKYLIDNKPEKIYDMDIENLLPQLENAKQISRIDFQQLIKNYLNDYRDLSKIPTKIEVGYPLELNFTNLRIVDTPGVNARGGFQYASLDYICNANAVIIVHHLNNIASEYLEEFFNKKIPNQAKKNIFMILSHKSLFTEEDIEEKIKEAKNLFQERIERQDSVFEGIKEGRILVVDNMLKMIYEEVLSNEDIDIKERYKNDEKFKLLISSYLVDYDGDREAIKKAVYQDSNFELLGELLKEFSENAIESEIISIVNIIADAYREQRKIYEEIVELTENKFQKNRDEFAQEIDTRKDILERSRANLDDFFAKRAKQYTASNSIIEKSFRTIEEKYHTQIEELRLEKLSEAKNISNFEDKIRKYVLDFFNECEENILYLESSLTKEYKDKMDKLEIAFKKQANVVLPKIDLEEMMKRQRELSLEKIEENEKVEENFSPASFLGAALGINSMVGGGVVGFGIAGAIGLTVMGASALASLAKSEEGNFPKDKKLNIEAYKYSLIEETKTTIAITRLEITEVSSDLFDKYAQNFSSKLKDAIEERQRAYDNLEQKDKENWESYDKQMQMFQFTLGFINDQANSIDELTANPID